MPPRFAPVGHEDQLTLVDHLTELRSRLFSSIIFVFIAFALTFWQANSVLHFITKPVDHALSSHETGKGKDKSSDELTYEYQQRISKAVATLKADNADLGSAVTAIGTSKATSADTALKGEIAALQAKLAQRQKVLNGINLTAPAIDRRPITLGVTEPFLVTITSSLYAALLISLPFLLYQIYAFVLPAFTPRERRVALPLMLAVPFLFLAGVLFAYYLVLPQATNFLLNFNSGEFNIEVQGEQAVKFVTTFLIAIGLMFQLPVGILAITRSGIISVKQLRQFRGYAIVLFAIIAAVLTPTPDPGTMMLAMAPLVVLYEVSIIAASWLDRIKPIDDELVAQDALDDLSQHYAPLPVDDDD